MTLYEKSVSIVGPQQLREKNLFCTIIFKILQRVTTLRTFLIQFHVERREMRSTLTVDLVSVPMNQNTVALTPN